MTRKVPSRIRAAANAALLAASIVSGASGLPADTPETPPDSGGDIAEPRWKGSLKVKHTSADALCEKHGGEMEEYDFGMMEESPGQLLIWTRVQCVDPLTDEVLFQCVEESATGDLWCTWGDSLWLPGPDGTHAELPTDGSPGALDEPDPVTTAGLGAFRTGSATATGIR